MFSNVLKRFLDYVKVNTRSDENSNTIPSTESQVIFAKKIEEELIGIGMKDVWYNDHNGYVIGTLPSNSDKIVSTIGFIAHMDTADFNSEDVRPNIIRNYDGKDVILNAEKNIVLKVSEFPNLANYKNQTLITTDGDTLLGADDKAGIAEIITSMEYLINNPQIKHGKVMVAFGPDEEIGRGMDNFNIKDFDVDFAYTIDGSRVGELQYETFNAAKVKVTLLGKSFHTGTAKGKLVNALGLAIEFQNLLPQDEVPEKTQGYEGFIHLEELVGNVQKAEMKYIIRNHSMVKLDEYKKMMLEIQEKINKRYDQKRVLVEIVDQYKNMKEIIEKNMAPIELAKEAMKIIGITPIIEPIRGGTDGATLSFLGIPTPNLFAGGENFHGPYEFISVSSMEAAIQTINEIIILNAK